MTQRSPEAVAPAPDAKASSENPSQGASSSGSGGAPPDAYDPPDFSIWISDARLSVLMDCPDPHADLAGTVERIIDDLEGFELPSPPVENDIAARITEHCQPGENAVACPILTGTDQGATVYPM